MRVVKGILPVRQIVMFIYGQLDLQVNVMKSHQYHKTIAGSTG